MSIGPPDKKPPSASRKPQSKDEPPGFYALAPKAIEMGLGEIVNELVKAPGSWLEKTAKLRTAMMNATAA